MPEDENGETMPRRLYCLTMPPAEEAGRPVSDLTGLKLPPEVLLYMLCVDFEDGKLAVRSADCRQELRTGEGGLQH